MLIFVLIYKNSKAKKIGYNRIISYFPLLHIYTN